MGKRIKAFAYGDIVKVSDKLSGKVIGYQGKLDGEYRLGVLLPDGSIRTVSEKDLLLLNLE